MKTTYSPLINLGSVLKNIRFQHKQKTMHKILFHKQAIPIVENMKFDLKVQKGRKKV